MNREPIVDHISAMLRELEEEPLRAAYMVVKQLHDLQSAVKNKIT